MAKLAVWIPTYGRPHKLQAVADNLKANTYNDFQLYWGVEPNDRESILAAKDTGYPVIINEYDKGYSNTIQTIYEQTDELVFFHGNDDFVYLKDWDKAPLEYMEKYPDIMVLGAHDGNPKTRFYTICFIKRQYIEEQSGVIDMPNRVFYPYKHNYQDTEFSETAVSRGVWDKLDVPCIEHHNPGLSHLFGDIEHDETYAMNDKTAGEDAATYNSRLKLWNK